MVIISSYRSHCWTRISSTVRSKLPYYTALFRRFGIAFYFSLAVVLSMCIISSLTRVRMDVESWYNILNPSLYGKILITPYLVKFIDRIYLSIFPRFCSLAGLIHFLISSLNFFFVTINYILNNFVAMKSQLFTYIYPSVMSRILFIQFNVNV